VKLKFLSLFLLLSGPWVPFAVSESSPGKYSESFYVNSAGSDSDACWMWLVNGHTLYYVRGGGIIHCQMFNPGETLHGMFYGLGHTSIRVVWFKDGKEKTSTYGIVKTQLMPQH
jgi:hypothetical protein